MFKLNLPVGARKNWFKYFQYEEERDTPSDTRNILLIVFTLVATVTFQAGITPPGGVWQDSKDKHVAGRAIYASEKVPYYVFLIFNTLAFSNSILVILSLTHKFPFNFEIWVASISMVVTYGSAVFAVSPGDTVKFRYVLITSAGPFMFRFLVMFYNLFLKKRFPDQKVEHFELGSVNG